MRYTGHGLRVTQVTFTGGTLAARYEIDQRSEIGLTVLIPKRFFVRLRKDDLLGYRSFPSIQLRLVAMSSWIGTVRTVESKWVNLDHAIANPPPGVVKLVPKPLPTHAMANPPRLDTLRSLIRPRKLAYLLKKTRD